MENILEREIAAVRNKAELQYSAFVENLGSFAEEVAVLHGSLQERTLYFPHMVGRIVPIAEHARGLLIAAFNFDETMGRYSALADLCEELKNTDI